MEARIAKGDKKNEHVLDLLSPFVDGETSIDETRHVERHIAACSLCSGQLAFLRATARTMRHASDALPSPALFERIARATYEKPTFGARLSEFLRPAPVRMALGGVLAAGLVAAVMVPRFATVSQVQPNGSGESAKPDLASVPSPAKTVKTPAGKPSRLASTSKPAPQATPFALSPQTASLGVSLARNIGRYLPSSTAPTTSVSKPTARPVAPRSVVDERSTFVKAITQPDPRSNRSVQAPPAAPIVARPKTNAGSYANTVPAAASRLIRTGAAKLMTTQNSGLVAAMVRNELANRSIASRAERPALPKVEAPTAVAAVAPDPVKPTSKPEETTLPNPIADTPRVVARKSGFSLAGSGTGTKNAGFSLISNRENFSALNKDGVVGIVQAPMGSK